MAWSNSKIFRKFVADVFSSTSLTSWTGLDSDSCKAALYNNTITPNQDETTAVLTAYNGAASQWVTGGEVVDTLNSNWNAGGVVLTTPVVDAGTAGVVFFDADDTAGAGNVTLTNAYGCLVYDNTITSTEAKRGVCFNYFGGAQSVTAGTFTVVWSANGVLRFTL